MLNCNSTIRIGGQVRTLHWPLHWVFFRAKKCAIFTLFTCLWLLQNKITRQRIFFVTLLPSYIRNAKSIIFATRHSQIQTHDNILPGKVCLLCKRSIVVDLMWKREIIHCYTQINFEKTKDGSFWTNMTLVVRIWKPPSRTLHKK